MELLLATQNEHKKDEILSMLPDLKLKTFKDFNFSGEIEETGSTFEENALIKAEFGYNLSQITCFSDDSGLVIDSLDGAPGIYSARYSGTGSFADNIAKVLKNMAGQPHRKACFICVICLFDGKEPRFFEGKIHGTIAEEIKGSHGFGYDPIFIPNGYDQSFAQLPAEEKNRISHRSIALQKFFEFLQK
ncbi:MAG: RdgB/HAM1 family non-canonical purine NTP pyrophosphatase [Flavobacteriaceae bacterium]|jgi:XTP/dITP diphosphohydrolase|nr:RdgB/HAM1 family non-canonical purine NTP pyrophosphatase [Flavobacteriaceae bacterium]